MEASSSAVVGVGDGGDMSVVDFMKETVPLEDQYVLVLHCDGGYVQAGFAGDNAPRVVFPLIVARPKYPNVMSVVDDRAVYIGDEARMRRGAMAFSSFFHRGVVTDWEKMERIWHHTFYNEMKVAPEEHPLLVTEPLLNPKANRERMTRMAFEVFDVLSIQFVCSALAAGISAGPWWRFACLVVDVGHTLTQLL